MPELPYRWGKFFGILSLSNAFVFLLIWRITLTGALDQVEPFSYVRAGIAFLFMAGGALLGDTPTGSLQATVVTAFWFVLCIGLLKRTHWGLRLLYVWVAAYAAIGIFQLLSACAVASDPDSGPALLGAAFAFIMLPGAVLNWFYFRKRRHMFQPVPATIRIPATMRWVGYWLIAVMVIVAVGWWVTSHTDLSNFSEADFRRILPFIAGLGVGVRVLLKSAKKRDDK